VAPRFPSPEKQQRYCNAVSPTNLELIRAVFEAWGHGDVDQPLREHFEPTARLDLSENIFNSAVYEGYDDMARQRREVSDVWDHFEIEVEQFFEGKDVVVAYTHEHGRGKGSGVEVDRDTAFLFRLREGKISEVRNYRNRERALTDAGLACSSGS
jgi:ketosteroid isomerase-like protein